MSRFEIKMPKLAESITEGLIVSWSVKVGDMIKEDDVLFDVETAKVSSEIPSPVAGKVIEILFKAGETVPVGAVVAVIDLDGDTSGDVPASSTVSAIPAVPKEEELAPTVPASEVTSKLSKEEDEKWFSPVVLELAKKAKISVDELNEIPGTGYMGRLSKKNMVDYISRKVKGVSTTIPASQPTPQQPATQKEAVKDIPRLTSDTVVEMDTIRRITAERMIESKRASAHVTTVVEVDVTKLVNWRNKLKDKFNAREGIALTYMPAIVQAVTKALIEYPEINVSVNGNQIIRKKDINVGIAVALDGWNLIVPVIHEADKLSISGLAQQIDSLAQKARNNKLKLDEIQGGTFTITNFGSFKNILGTPIINQPEVAILGVGYIEKKPAVITTPEGDVIAIRHKMYLSLSYDHRVIDGALGGSFVRRVGDILENWKDEA